MALFPIFVKLDGRPCLVVGAGNVALEPSGLAQDQLRIAASQDMRFAGTMQALRQVCLEQIGMRRNADRPNRETLR